MKKDLIRNAQATIDFKDNFLISGDNINWVEKKYSDLAGLYENQAEAKENHNIAYKIADNICMEHRDKGMYWSMTYLQPGMIDKEYNFTRGYFYVGECNEFYFCFQGEGHLIFWDGEKDFFVEKMYQGSVHWMPGKYARRIVNTGSEKLVVGVSWGYFERQDHERIAKEGFPLRIFAGETGIEIVVKDEFK